MRKTEKQLKLSGSSSSSTISAATRSHAQNSATNSAHSQVLDDEDSGDSAPDEHCRCGDSACNFTVIMEDDLCLQCAYCKDFVLLRCLGSDSDAVFKFVQHCPGLAYSCPGCQAEALPSASAAGLAKVDRKIDSLLNLFLPGSTDVSGPDFSSESDWPRLTRSDAPVAPDAPKQKPFPRPSIPALSDAVEVALEKREQKDCLVLSGVKDMGDNQKDLRTAASILKQLKITSRPVKTFRMGSTGKKGQPKLLKVQLQSSHDRNQALRNTRNLADTEFQKVFVRPSLSADERKRLKVLMKERWERNNAGDFCYIDWSSLSLKRSRKSPNHPDHPDHAASRASSENKVTDSFDATVVNSNSKAILSGSTNSGDSGN